MGGPLYKVQHRSGRILGPVGIDRIKRLIKRRELQGTEVARRYPEGPWISINAIPEISELFLLHAQGKLRDPLDSMQTSYEPILSSSTAADRPQFQDSGATIVLTPEQKAKVVVDDSEQLTQLIGEGDESKTEMIQAGDLPEDGTQHGRGEIIRKKEPIQTKIELEGEPTRLTGNLPSTPVDHLQMMIDIPIEIDDSDPKIRKHINRVANEATVMVDRPKGLTKVVSRFPASQWLKIIVFAVGLYYLLDDYLEDDSGKSALARPQVILVQPKLPKLDNKKIDSKTSRDFYLAALKLYDRDTVKSYFNAIKLLTQAVTLDPSNVEAIALLASAYLNTIDSTNKDDAYFTVVGKLIEMSQAHHVDLPATVRAEVEFLIVTHRVQAAINRIQDYTKKNRNFDPIMFYYVSLAFAAKGDYTSAATYLNHYPDHQASSPRVAFLRGRIAEGLKDLDAAKVAYERALKINPEHATSKLALVRMANDRGELKEVSSEVVAMVKKPEYLSPLDMGRAYYYLGRLFEIEERWVEAAEAFERAIGFDKRQWDYRVEYFTALSNKKEIGDRAKQDARMYFFISEGEKALKRGESQEAMNYFLQARDTKPKSLLPIIKLGDFFFYKKDYVSARMNYEKAAKRDTKDPDIWSKYVDTLIQSYEWEEATQAISKFRRLAVSQSFIDKAQGDLLMKQSQFPEAQIFYKKAMQRESIDPDVYAAYGKSLIATRNYKEAPFYLSLARRFDPVGVDPALDTAKAIAESESIDAGIRYLQDELQQGELPRGDLLSGIAELYLKKGQLDQAEASVEQARLANPELAAPWRIKAQIHIARENTEKKALQHALDAYTSFIERNPSDPTGYFDRYSLFMKLANYDEAQHELERIQSFYPKYPNLHLYKGMMYSTMGNFKAAVPEYEFEIKQNERHTQAYLGAGKAYLELRNYESASKNLQMAMRLNPQWAEAKLYAAIANQKLKNFVGAIALFKSAAAIDSGNPLLYKRMMECYVEMGETQNAQAAFDKYRQLEPDAPDLAEYRRLLNKR